MGGLVRPAESLPRNRPGPGLRSELYSVVDLRLFDSRGGGLARYELSDSGTICRLASPWGPSTHKTAFILATRSGDTKADWDGSGDEANFVTVRWDHIAPIDERITTEDLLSEIPDVKWNNLYESGRMFTGDNADDILILTVDRFGLFLDEQD